MRDLIDERNFREKCARSIVKNYNVHYITQEELETQQLKQAKEVVEQAKYGAFNEIISSLDIQEDSPSVEEPTEERDPISEEQIRKILGEREEQLAETIEESLTLSAESVDS